MHRTEYQFFKRFMRMFKFPFEVQKFDKSERPDFLVHGENFVLGIEMTEIFKEFDLGEGTRPRQALESEWERTCRLSKSIWEELELPNVSVHIKFDDRYDVNKTNFEFISDRLVEIVRRNIPQMGCHRAVNTYEYFCKFELPMVSTITMARSEVLCESSWVYDDGGSVPVLNTKHLQRAIDRKNQKVSAYLGNCDEAWLLLVVEGFRGSSFMSITEDLLAHEFESKFEKTLLFHTLRGVSVLQTEK